MSFRTRDHFDSIPVSECCVKPTEINYKKFEKTKFTAMDLLERYALTRRSRVGIGCLAVGFGLKTTSVRPNSHSNIFLSFCQALLINFTIVNNSVVREQQLTQ